MLRAALLQTCAYLSEGSVTEESSYPLTVTDEDDRLEPSALNATTLTTVGPEPTLSFTDQVPSAPTATRAPLTVTLAPGAALPEMCASPEPLATLLTMLTFAADWYIGSSLSSDL